MFLFLIISNTYTYTYKYTYTYFIEGLKGTATKKTPRFPILSGINWIHF